MKECWKMRIVSENFRSRVCLWMSLGSHKLPLWEYFSVFDFCSSNYLIESYRSKLLACSSYVKYCYLNLNEAPFLNKMPPTIYENSFLEFRIIPSSIFVLFNKPFWVALRLILIFSLLIKTRNWLYWEVIEQKKNNYYQSHSRRKFTSASKGLTNTS